MKWSDVQITDEKDKVYTGKEAKRFVAANCQPIAMRTTTDDVIIVNTRASSGTGDDRQVRLFLFTHLLGKAKSLKFLKGKDFQRESLPLARKDWNLVNVNPAKLKVQFIYKQDVEDLSAPKFLEDSTVTVKALHAESNNLLTMETVKGIADFGVRMPGKYKITADYPESDECKYDGIDKTRDVVLHPASTEIVEFEVEPLYQKVQFIAHCLLTIPNQIFVESEEDKAKMLIKTESDGKRSFEFQTNPHKKSMYQIADLKPPLPPEKAAISYSKETGIGTLSLKKIIPPIEYWKLEEVETDKLPKEVTIKEKLQDIPPVYRVEFEKGYNPDPLPAVPGERGTINKKRVDVTTLSMQKKPLSDEYWTLEDLDEKTLDETLIKIKEKIGDDPPVYAVEFFDAGPGDLKPPVPSDKGRFTTEITNPIELTLMQKPRQEEFWKLTELNDHPNLKMINIGEPIKTNPNMYEFTFKQGFDKDSLDPLLNDEKASIVTFPACKLTLKKKPKDEWWMKKDLDPATLDPEKIEFIGTESANSKTFRIKFKPRAVFYDTADLTGKWQAKYHGFVEDGDDIKARVKFVADTLEKAYVESKKEPTILKVFMIPECFFQGLYGAYITDDAAKLVEMLQKLVAGKKWKDWVFSFGTVNRVFEGLPPEGMTHEKPIYEMANHAPVIRGGLGESSYAGDGSTRLIQKLVNSAELADEADLIRDPRAKRRQAVNEEVQFEATENDEKAAKFLERLLQVDRKEGSPGTLFIGGKGLPSQLWRNPPEILASEFKGLKEQIEEFISKQGMARIIRQIRISANNKVNARPLKDWAYCATDANLDTYLPTPEQATLLVLKTQWNKLYAESEFNKSEWENETNRKATVSTALSDFAAVTKKCGFNLTYQQTEIKKIIQGLRDNDLNAKAFIPDKPVLSFEPSIFPLWRKLLELWMENEDETVPLQMAKGSMKVEDYVFAGPRKPGGWFKNVNDAQVKDMKPCKRLVFGLEICADHADGRINQINKDPNLIDIDIHLVPSAGMSPKNFAARKGGYLFNCDGWNQQPKGGRTIVTNLDGPSPFKLKVPDKPDKPITPVYPHSAVAKRTDALLVESCLEPTTIVTPDAELSKEIFGDGPGELHFYELQELPK